MLPRLEVLHAGTSWIDCRILLNIAANRLPGLAGSTARGSAPPSTLPANKEMQDSWMGRGQGEMAGG